MSVRRNAKSGAGSFAPQLAGTPTLGAGSSQAGHGGAPHGAWGPCQADHITLALGPPLRPHRRRVSKTWRQRARGTHHGELRGTQGQLPRPLAAQSSALPSPRPLKEELPFPPAAGAPPWQGKWLGEAFVAPTPDLLSSIPPPSPTFLLHLEQASYCPLFSPRCRNCQWRPCS